MTRMKPPRRISEKTFPPDGLQLVAAELDASGNVLRLWEFGGDGPHQGVTYRYLGVIKRQGREDSYSYRGQPHEKGLPSITTSNWKEAVGHLVKVNGLNWA